MTEFEDIKSGYRIDFVSTDVGPDMFEGGVFVFLPPFGSDWWTFYFAVF